jgi:hypothetical protein
MWHGTVRRQLIDVWKKLAASQMEVEAHVAVDRRENVASHERFALHFRGTQRDLCFLKTKKHSTYLRI